MLFTFQVVAEVEWKEWDKETDGPCKFTQEIKATGPGRTEADGKYHPDPVPGDLNRDAGDNEGLKKGEKFGLRRNFDGTPYGSKYGYEDATSTQKGRAKGHHERDFRVTISGAEGCDCKPPSLTNEFWLVVDTDEDPPVVKWSGWGDTR